MFSGCVINPSAEFSHTTGDRAALTMYVGANLAFAC
jgi:hypothetical protein